MGQALRSVVLSYDFSDASADIVQLQRKYDRDGITGELLILCFGATARTQSNGRITVVSKRARLGTLRPLYDLLFIYFAPRIVVEKQFQPQEIIIADFALAWAAHMVKRMCGGKVILRLSGLLSEVAQTRSILHFFYARLNEFFTRRMIDEYVAINGTTRNYLLARGIAPERIRIQTPNTINKIDAERARAQIGSVRARFNIPKHAAIILSVGRLEREKGFDELLRMYAASEVDAYLLIVGGGALRLELATLTKALGVAQRVVFVGAIPHEKIWDFYADADVFVLLSKSEALGLVVWEAMYMGLPVIGRRTGGILESIGENEERGIFWDTKDGATSFRASVEQCIERGEGVLKRIERARAYVVEQLAGGLGAR